MRKISKILVLCIVAVTLLGCGIQTEQSLPLTLKDGQIGIYYLDSKTQGLVQEAYEPLQKDTDSLAQELFGQLKQQPKKFACQSAIPDDVNLLESRLEEKKLTLNLEETYYSMDSISEVLCRAAIVRTMMQMEGVEEIEFTVGNQPLVDKTGHTIGVMTNDTFVDVDCSESTSYQETELNLYFSNASGTGLVLVKRTVMHHTNISMEKLVVEQLLKGINNEENSSLVKAALPSDAKIVNIYTKDGVCYVNFDEKFLNLSTGVSEEIVIYSLVNSLTEIPGITQVHISVNGESNRMYKDKINLNNVFERNTSYIEET